MSKGARFFYDFVLTLGLVILGWIAANLQNFRLDPLVEILSLFTYSWSIVFLVLLLIESVLTIFFTPRHIRPADEDNERWRFWHGTILETVVVLAIFSDRKGLALMGDSISIRFVGIILMLTAIVLSTWSGWQRKQQIQSETENSFLTKGFNRWIRYPDQLSTVLSFTGYSLLFNSWVGLFLVVMLLISMVRYTRVLDELKTTKYKSDWVIYEKRTKRLLPFLF